MNQLENPLPGMRQTGKGLAGVVDGGRGGKGRAGANGRGELGSAFTALLQSVGGKTAHAGREAQNADKVHRATKAQATEGKNEQEADSASDKATEAALALLDGAGKSADAATASSASTTPASADAAATLLLGALQAATTPREVSEPRGKGENGARRDGAIATPGHALADAGHKGAHRTGVEMPGAVDPAPVEMPSNATAPAELPSGDALAALSALVDDAGDSSKPAAPADGEPAKPIAVTIVKQETYLPPVMRASPFEQVVEPLKQAVGDLLATRSQASSELGSDKPVEISAPTKVLHLELRPVELGSLTVKMRLAQGGMEIRIEADKAETARMLANDKDALREVVKQSGFSVDAVSIETVHVDGPDADHRHGPGQDASRNETSEQRQGRGFEQSRQGEQQAQQQEPQRRGWNSDANRKDEAHELDAQDHRGSDVLRYV